MTRTTADDAATAILETIPATMRAIRNRMRTSDGHDISVAQFRVLLFVRRHPGTSLSPVAEHLGISLPAASQLVSRLVRDGLLSRRPSRRQVRCVELDLEDAGREILAERDARTRAWLSAALSSLDDAALERLVSALSDLRAIASDRPPHPQPSGQPDSPASSQVR